MILECQIICECDECGQEETFDVNADHNGFANLELKRSLKQSGWTIDLFAWGGPRIRCDDCSNSAS